MTEFKKLLCFKIQILCRLDYEIVIVSSHLTNQSPQLYGSKPMTQQLLKNKRHLTKKGRHCEYGSLPKFHSIHLHFQTADSF